MGLLVVDSGTLIALAKLGLRGLPGQVFGQVLGPEAVFNECLAQSQCADAAAIRQAVASGVLCRIPADVPSEEVRATKLDPGETAAIASALARDAEILIDERQGRRSAQALGLR